MSERYGTPVTLHLQAGRPLPLDEVSATHVYRICQEALINAMRHAGASQVWIHLADLGNELQVCVEDDGHGLASGERPGTGGLGLRIMRYRAQMLGGDLAIESGNRGTTVRCSCPLRR